MATPPVSPISYGNGYSGNSISDQPITAGLTQADFLKIIIQNLSQQDPFKAADSTKFLDQIMDIANLQSIQSMGLDSAKQYNLQQQLYSQGLIGKNVQLQDSATDTTITGQIQSARIQDGDVKVTIAGKEYSAANIFQYSIN